MRTMRQSAVNTMRRPILMRISHGLLLIPVLLGLLLGGAFAAALPALTGRVVDGAIFCKKWLRSTCFVPKRPAGRENEC